MLLADINTIFLIFLSVSYNQTLSPTMNLFLITSSETFIIKLDEEAMPRSTLCLLRLTDIRFLFFAHFCRTK